MVALRKKTTLPTVSCLQYFRYPLVAGLIRDFSLLALLPCNTLLILISHLVQPEGTHDEEELNAHRTKRQYPPQRDRERGVRVPHLVWDMPARRREKVVM